MLHQHIHFFAFEAQCLRVHQTQVSAIAIAAYGSEMRLHGFKPLRQFRAADVPSVPYLIQFAHVVLIAIVPKTMGVTDDTDFFHFSIHFLM